MKRRIIAFLLVFCLCASLMPAAFAAGGTFSDVPAKHWANAYVERAAANGWVVGTGGGKFSPDGKVTGAEWYTMVTRAFFGGMIPESADGGRWYSGKWYAPYMQAAEELRLDEYFDGATSETAAARPLTRTEMACVAARVLEHAGISVSESDLTETAAAIADADRYDPASDSFGAIVKSYALGILSGVDSRGTFGGGGQMTRAQAAVVLCKLADVIESLAPAQEPSREDAFTQAVYDAITALRELFPDGTPWTTTSSYYSAARPNTTLTGCAAFAQLLSDAAFGMLPERRHESFDEIRVGDIVRYGGRHSVVVLEKRADSIIVVEGSYDYAVLWGREIPRADLDKEGFFVRTRYPE